MAKRREINYKFPVTDSFEAMEVLDTDFDMDFYGVREQLFVDIEQFRGKYGEEEFADTYREEILRHLNISQGKLKAKPVDYKKILLSGHRGSGKTTEIRSLFNYLKHPDRYYAVKMEIEQDLEPFKMQGQDFYIMLVKKIIMQLKEDGLDELTNHFDPILEEWLSEEEVVKEIKSKKAKEDGAEVGLDTGSLIPFLKFKVNFKDLLASETTTTEKLRSVIKRTLPDFVRKLNVALAIVQDKLAKMGHGKDICVVIDGAEKTAWEVYEEVYIRNGQFLRDVNANMISTVNIAASAHLAHKNDLDFYERVYLPMVKINTEPKKEKMREIISRRVDIPSLFEDEAVEEIIRLSGGSFRQLIRLANQCIFKAHKLLEDGKLVPARAVAAVVKDEQSRYMDALSKNQKEILRKRTWDEDRTDEAVSQLFYSLAIIRYNGDSEINPILQPLFEEQPSNPTD